ncbi:MAG TPA: glucose-6-phosphate dehydrogenase [Candidatus Saccharimonadia bacterium]|nr:glucose-6-phosphate dehydrogenase [Candidatus Saccharimonadia bacterium]
MVKPKPPLPANPPAPAALVIFGVTGNLAQHMLLPALYHLESQQLLPEEFYIVGIFRRVPDVDAILHEATAQLEQNGETIDPAVTSRLKSRLHTIKMDSTNPSDFSRLAELLHGLDDAAGTKLNHLFYLAIPPDIFETVIDNLATGGLNHDDADRSSRLLIEKPFGYDLASAEALIDAMSAHFDEHQIFRIDHYLAKETAQNILTFRFSNPLIQGIWSREFIDHIQITATEKIGIQGRVAFYEKMGALRDFVQSHLMQLMALVMMEYPEDLTSEAIHAEKLKVLESIETITPHSVPDVAVRGQYAGYRDEVGDPGSTTETYAALKLEVANSRWGGVPILLRTGKSLARKTTEIVVVFKDRTRKASPDNLLVIRIQPDEGISLKLLAKKPGFDDQLQPVQMDFSYSGVFDGHQPDAYQRVLIDALRGDHSLFATNDEVLVSWRILQPVLDAWSHTAEPPQSYARGSRGPADAQRLAANYGSQWIDNHTPRQP